MSRHLSFDRLNLQERIGAEGQKLGQLAVMSDLSTRLLNIVGVTQDGYVRMYKIRENNSFEVFAQLNVQDRVL